MPLTSLAPGFRKGAKKVFFPWSSVILLPQTARHTPYQAYFQVPINFNKYDLRDYLQSIYGLTVRRVTTHIMSGSWIYVPNEREIGRAKKYGETPPAPKSVFKRQAPRKRMVVDMDQPFIWPREEQGLREKMGIEWERSNRALINMFQQINHSKVHQTDNRHGNERTRVFDNFYRMDQHRPPKPFVSAREKAHHQKINKKTSKTLDLLNALQSQHPNPSVKSQE